MFPLEVMNRFPLPPPEEEGRLNDMPLRENHIERIFAYYRWTDRQIGKMLYSRSMTKREFQLTEEHVQELKHAQCKDGPTRSRLLAV